MSATPAAAEPNWIPRLRTALAGNEERYWDPAFDWLRLRGGPPRATLAPASVLAAIMDGAAGPGIVLTRRRDGLSRHPGQVALPGGARESTDATAEETALREAREEVGLAPDAVRLLGRLPRFPTVSGYLITPVVGYVASPYPLRADPAEVAAVFVLPLSILLAPERWREHPLEVAGGARIPHRELTWEGERIWGVTAGVLEMLIGPLRAVRDRTVA